MNLFSRDNSRVQYVVDLFDANGYGDCIPEFFDTLAEAEAAGQAEVARVAALVARIERGEDVGLAPWDYAVRFEIRECSENDDSL